VALPVPFHSYTYQEYLALEVSSNVKHEFLNGEIYAMAGGTPEHAALTMAIGAALVAQLRGGDCRVYSADLRIRVLASGLTAYPDVSVVCGDVRTDPESAATVVNPKLLVEVLSEGTSSYDRGEKLAQYKSIDSLQAVLLFSQTTRRVEIHERADEGWQMRVVTGDQLLSLPSIAAELSLASVYGDAGL
jgi:Uma2 family endonuclease